MNLYNNDKEHKEIPNHLKRVHSRLLRLTESYQWKGIKCPSDQKDWTKFKQNSKNVILNILFVT